MWYNADVRDEVIKVKDGEDVHLRTWATHHGPVVGGDPMSGYGLALRYTAGDGGDPWTDILPAMLEATSVEELADAMEGWVDPVNNFVMADVHGNIGYQCRGEIPRRPGDVPAPLPVPGWDGEHEWQGSIPFEDMPRYINPSQGYIVTANNRPVGEDYPYYISMDFAPGYRAMRVTHGVESISNAAAADMGRIHAERVSIPAKAYVSALAGLTAPDDPVVAAALDTLQKWSGSIDPGAVEPTIYSAMRDALLWRLLKHNIGEDLAAMGWQPADRGRGVFLNRFKNLMTDAISAGDTDLLPDGEDWPGALTAALQEAVRTLDREAGLRHRRLAVGPGASGAAAASAIHGDAGVGPPAGPAGNTHRRRRRHPVGWLLCAGRPGYGGRALCVPLCLRPGRLESLAMGGAPGSLRSPGQPALLRPVGDVEQGAHGADALQLGTDQGRRGDGSDAAGGVASPTQEPC